MKEYIEKKANHLQKFIKENYLFVAILCFFAGLFYYKMFTNVLYDDEVGTYVSIITKGFFTALFKFDSTANHLFFNGLSTLLNPLNNVYLSVRGISYISFVLMNIVVYKTCINKCSRGASAFAILIMNSFYCINFYAVAGRGYMLICLLFSLSINIAVSLMENPNNRKFWIAYIIVNALGFYTISTYLYAFLTLSLAWGLYWLRNKKTKELLKLIINSAWAGVLTFALYVPVFICCSLFMMVQNREIEKSGQVFLKTFLSNPIKMVIEGIQIYVGKTSYYINTYSLKTILQEMGGFYQKIMEFVFYKEFPFISLLLSISIIMICAWIWIKKKEEFLPLLALIGLLVPFIIMMVQRIFPFERLFTYISLTVVFAMAYVYDQVLCRFRMQHIYKGVGIALAGILVFMVYTSDSYMNSYKGTVDESVENAVKFINAEEYSTDAIGVQVDGFQQYNYLMMWSLMHDKKVNFDAVEPDIVIYTNDDNIESISKEMMVYYRDDNIVAYRKNVVAE